MKKVLLCAALLAAALPAPALAEDILTAENSFTDAVKSGYQDFKDSVNEVFGGYTGNDAKDARIYQERQKQDIDAYRKAIHDAREDFRRARMDEQGEYLKHHRQLPAPEDIDAELNMQAPSSRTPAPSLTPSPSGSSLPNPSPTHSPAPTAAPTSM